ncbi:MAG TPA: aminotransferase class I/II-fold pyridoxal phosphate-dependent enzyme, partial [Tepidiformaceae bacterium]|nr:aminotransferase class I/II-fold pyridoxal phosphate-dependent enzyme [Tepidiformaceae bacterium]
YLPATVMAGGTFVPVPTYASNDFRLLAADVEAAVTPRARAILLGYPSNPTGATMGLEDLLAIAEVAKRHDLAVISDELYDRMTYVGEHTCFASLPGTQDRTVLLGG